MTQILRKSLSAGVILARRLGFYPYGFRGNYSSWHEAITAAGGDYQSDAIVTRNIRATEQFIRDLGRAPDNHPSTLRICHNIDLCSRASAVPHVLDFGGSLGRHYFGVRSVIPTSRRLNWTVWETKPMARAGHRHFLSDELTFVDEAADLRSHYDLGIASGSLQYVERPWETLRLLLSKVSLLIVDRLPLIDGTSDRLTVQRVPPWIYRATYPAWFLACANWARATGRTVLDRWSLSEQVWLDGQRVTDAGYLLRSRSLDASPVDNDGIQEAG